MQNAYLQAINLVYLTSLEPIACYNIWTVQVSLHESSTNRSVKPSGCPKNYLLIFQQGNLRSLTCIACCKQDANVLPVCSTIFRTPLPLSLYDPQPSCLVFLSENLKILELFKQMTHFNQMNRCSLVLTTLCCIVYPIQIQFLKPIGSQLQQVNNNAATLSF